MKVFTSMRLKLKLRLSSTFSFVSGRSEGACTRTICPRTIKFYRLSFQFISVGWWTHANHLGLLRMDIPWFTVPPVSAINLWKSSRKTDQRLPSSFSRTTTTSWSRQGNWSNYSERDSIRHTFDSCPWPPKETVQLLRKLLDTWTLIWTKCNQDICWMYSFMKRWTK